MTIKYERFLAETKTVADEFEAFTKGLFNTRKYVLNNPLVNRRNEKKRHSLLSDEDISQINDVKLHVNRIFSRL